MTLADAWSTYMVLLRERAPLTAASVRPPVADTDRDIAEAATTPWTEELRQFFSLHNGQVDSEESAGELLPDLILLPLDEVVSLHRSNLLSPHPIDDLGQDWPQILQGQAAGETAHTFLADYVPIAKDGAGDFYYVDTRSGPQQGCIRYFLSESADEGEPLYDSLTDYVDSIRRSAESGSEHNELSPLFRDDALFWEMGVAAEPVPGSASGVTVLTLPFAPTDFIPSQVPDNDLVDLVAVEGLVTTTARSLHPGSTIDGARSVYRKVPRQRGVSVTWWVSIDGEEFIYVAFITGVDNDAIVFEAPTGPYEIKVVNS